MNTPFPKISDYHYHQWLEMTIFGDMCRSWMCTRCFSWRCQDWPVPLTTESTTSLNEK